MYKYIKTAFFHTAATLASFVLAIIHFVSEVTIYGTMSWRKAATPLVVAGATALLSVLTTLTHAHCRVFDAVDGIRMELLHRRGAGRQVSVSVLRPIYLSPQPLLTVIPESTTSQLM